MSDIFNIIDSKSQRQSLRRDASMCERILWRRLSGRQLCGLRFRRQYGVGPYIIDFYCPEVKLAIEIDGHSHTFEERWRADTDRQRAIEAHGVKVVRFSNAQILEDI